MTTVQKSVIATGATLALATGTLLIVNQSVVTPPPPPPPKIVQPYCLDAVQGHHYQLQSSFDLVTWRDEVEVICQTNGRLDFPYYENTADFTQHYFRVFVKW